MFKTKCCSNDKKGHRVNISLSNEQLTMVRSLKGIMGNSDSEIIRNIILAWFSEKGIISDKLNGED